MKKIIVTIGIKVSDDTYIPDAWAFKTATEELLFDGQGDGKVEVVFVGGETATDYYSVKEEAALTIQPQRTMWADLDDLAQAKFRQLADDFDKRIPMEASSVEDAIENLVEGPLKKQAQRIYDTYVKETLLRTYC